MNKTPILEQNADGGSMVRLVSHSSEQLAMEILRSDMMITDARLSDAIDHEEGLRFLHDAAKDRVALLRAIKRDLQAKANSIFLANAQAEGAEASGRDTSRGKQSASL